MMSPVSETGRTQRVGIDAYRPGESTEALLNDLGQGPNLQRPMAGWIIDDLYDARNPLPIGETPLTSSLACPRTSTGT